MKRSRSRLRFGGSLHVCSNGAQYDTPGEPAQPVQNLFDSGYKSFVGTPEIGRMALLRLTYEF